MKADLIRIEEHPVDGSFGTLRMDGQAFCVTLEPPDRDNARNISNIPPGKYKAVRHYSPKFGWTFLLLDVPGRSNILLHAGNVVDDTKGCIVLGQYFGKLRGDRAVKNSGNTFKAFMGRLEGVDELDFEIKEV